MTGLLVSEEFIAPQGEGRNTGRLSYWIRCGGCNQRCSWCDTPYTWVFSERLADQHEGGKRYNPREELQRVDLAEITGRIMDSPVKAVTFTGGEPLLQGTALSWLADFLVNEGYAVDVETAGSIAPGYLASHPVQFTVSPKLASSGNPADLRRNPQAIRTFLGLDAVFKFVIDTRTRRSESTDLAEALMLIELWRIPADRVWLSPCGTTLNQVVSGMEKLEPVCRRNGFNLSSRLQVLMHGNERGF